MCPRNSLIIQRGRQAASLPFPLLQVSHFMPPGSTAFLPVTSFAFAHIRLARSQNRRFPKRLVLKLQRFPRSAEDRWQCLLRNRGAGDVFGSPAAPNPSLFYPPETMKK